MHGMFLPDLHKIWLYYLQILKKKPLQWCQDILSFSKWIFWLVTLISLDKERHQAKILKYIQTYINLICSQVNQMDNFLRRWNVEIQGVPVVDSENLKSLVICTLKVVDPRVLRKDFHSIKKMKPTRMAGQVYCI